MAEPNPNWTDRRVRRIGLATFAPLFLSIGFELWFLVFLDASTRRLFRGTVAPIAFVAASFVAGAVLCVLAVVYLRQLFRSGAAPRTKVLWTLLIVLFPLLAMPCYWVVYVRRQPHVAS
jgi:hypothetical protein